MCARFTQVLQRTVFRQTLAPVLLQQIVGLPRVHRQQPAGVGKVAEQLGRALGRKAQQTLTQGDVQAVTGNERALNGKPAQREAGGEIGQIAARLGFVERLVGLRCRVKLMADQQRLFRFGKRQRLIAQGCPTVA